VEATSIWGTDLDNLVCCSKYYACNTM